MIETLSTSRAATALPSSGAAVLYYTAGMLRRGRLSRDDHLLDLSQVYVSTATPVLDIRCLMAISTLNGDI